MPDKAIHIIQRQVFELSAASSKADLEWEKSAAQYLHTIIKPCIEACFDELPIKGQHLVIEKLEIDLGIFATGRFEKEAYGKLKEVLSRKLQELTATREIMDRDHMSEQELSAQSLPATDKPSAVRLSETKAVQQILLSFLATGRFPWWHRMHGHPAFLDDLFNLDWMRSLHEYGKATLKETLQTSAAARIRISNHFSAEWTGGCLQLLDMKGEEALRQLKILLPALASFRALQPLFHQYFWMMWMETGGSIQLPLLLERTAGGRNAFSLEIAETMMPLCEQDAVLKGHGAALRKYREASQAAGDQTAENIASATQTTASTENLPAETKALEERTPETDEAKMQEIFADIASQSLQRKSAGEKPKEEDALFVQAAGMVLLHPFLATLFRVTGLWEDQKWSSAQSPFRALQLLSWLAFGETGLHEYRLVFLKILVGLDPETPVPAELPLTEEEENACRELLQAVISHWNALRNTSPDGLQEGFLQRNGKLLPAGGKYLLHVEPLAQDVLLSRLPWGYTVVKLPWMKQMLHVTWI